MSKVLSLKQLADTTLYKELLNRETAENKSMIANLPDLCQEASDRIKLVPKHFPEYTLHDNTHFLRVTEIMSMILGNRIKVLNDLEIWFLIMSAFYHDQGMVLEGSEESNLDSDENYILFKKNWQIDHPNYFEIIRQLESNHISSDERTRIATLINELDAACLTDFLRINHGQRAVDYINHIFTNDPRLSIYGANLSHYLATICLSHTKSSEWLINESGLNYDDNIGNYRVNSIFLSLLLRLADILDFDSDRTPDVLFKSIHFTSQISVQEWQKHRTVQGWEINNSIIRFTMLFDHPVYEKTARGFLDWIDEELSDAQKILRNSPKTVSHYQLDIPEKTDRSRLSARNKSYLYNDVEFTLSRDEIVKLLLTDNLYRNTSLFIRELLQNGLDALRLRKALFAKEGINWTDGKIRFRHYIDENGENIVECEDNGVGMDELIISKFLGKVGRSYYRSPEFERLRILLKEKKVDFDPCAQFGIGFMSCFMVGDRIEILTKKDNGPGFQSGKPLKIEINGLGGLMVIRNGDKNQPIGTIIKVYCRDREPFYDDWSDPIRLTTTLKGVALANEFSIEASCEIEPICKSVSIPPIIDKKRTFLEKLNLEKIKTIEIDLTTIHPYLQGFLRQSFLLDDQGLPSFESSEAYFEIKTENNSKTNKTPVLTLYKKNSAENKEYNITFRDNHSVCIDGILVCGRPGRAEYDKHEMMMLGHLSTQIYSEHSFTIDVRGDIKPELNPAREPLDQRGIFRNAPKWRQLQYLIYEGNGKLWEQLLKQIKYGLSIETFWQLLIAYDGSISNIPSQSIYNFIKLPISGGTWISISSINYAFIYSENIVIIDTNETKHILEFPESIKRYAKTHHNGVNFSYLVSNVILGISNIEFGSENPLIKIRNLFSPGELPSHNIMKMDFSRVRFLSFTNVNKDIIACVQYEDLINLQSPIIRLSYECHLGNLTDALEHFSVTLTGTILSLIKHQKEKNIPFSLNVKSRSLKLLGYRYTLVNWNKYDDKFKPPYKIFVDNNTTLEVTHDLLKNWAQIKLN
ncbi:hypothetical protein [Sphingobacterium sp. UGAL515B_05]|uniref:HD domain-containing protein n=1 Tax=Sphingobacterium sp. UGAL515B_05 TaxID=2986767 RepID=UPI0029556EED|nr:hypothetical protein [Sphingobacterium sp. UGAL515B_05]WON95055.1 hypothetical protein OK025_01255 [Sphingobacterium sp. UGAL515B_05]